MLGNRSCGIVTSCCEISNEGKNAWVILYSSQSPQRETPHFCIAQPPESPYCEMLWIRFENKTFCYNAIGVFIAAYVNKPVMVGPWDTSITGWKLICVLHEGCLINFIEILFRNWIANDTSICESIYVIHRICAPCRNHLVYLFKHGLLVATEGLMSWRLTWGRHSFIS